MKQQPIINTLKYIIENHKDCFDETLIKSILNSCDKNLFKEKNFNIKKSYIDMHCDLWSFINFTYKSTDDLNIWKILLKSIDSTLITNVSFSFKKLGNYYDYNPVLKKQFLDNDLDIELSINGLNCLKFKNYKILTSQNNIPNLNDLTKNDELFLLNELITESDWLAKGLESVDNYKKVSENILFKYKNEIKKFGLNNKKSLLKIINDSNYLNYIFANLSKEKLNLFLNDESDNNLLKYVNYKNTAKYYPNILPKLINEYKDFNYWNDLLNLKKNNEFKLLNVLKDIFNVIDIDVVHLNNRVKANKDISKLSQLPTELSDGIIYRLNAFKHELKNVSDDDKNLFYIIVCASKSKDLYLEARTLLDFPEKFNFNLTNLKGELDKDEKWENAWKERQVKLLDDNLTKKSDNKNVLKI